MSDHNQANDRYVSFCGINCDGNADKLIEMLEQQLSSNGGAALWREYFARARQQQVKLAQDNLHFIGNQTNCLYEYFEQCNDEKALALLYKVEQECC
ncbi:N(2)-fixation sustaining protein CowN [Agarivorans sp. MS3-6]|uniref:N(2)-fixation sustaining protein CowN n=1 Tax=Agarivorans sp. TSD2052 TaxID=2937286 RepID=UPI00200C2DBF|nr:N(2)-fixation sustaining protein CowN [Agarivorans sp. TSD2052]UPW20570.1 N(2)-fixation sustaining protein CowN [Agarivorans sp. TSD2052]